MSTEPSITQTLSRQGSGDRPRGRRRARWMVCWLCWALAPAAGLAAGENAASVPPPGTPDRVWVITEAPLRADQLDALREVQAVLVMVPGVSSGDWPATREFLDEIRQQGGHDLALFYDWGAGTLSRWLVSPLATAAAARRLVGLVEAFQAGAATGRTVDVLAHSAGTVVINKAARETARQRQPVRFRHVLLLGTALDADASLTALRAVSARVLNVHSEYDKVNRNINDRLGTLAALEGGANQHRDRSLGGRLMRHDVFLASDPENWIAYGTYLGTGEWPAPRAFQPGVEYTPAELYRLALWVQGQPGQADPRVAAAVPGWLAAADPRVQYYAVVLAGRLGLRTLAPVLQTMAADRETPVYLRREIYQAVGNWEDGRFVRFLQEARDRDPACDEVLRDVLRRLQRQRVRPVR